MVDTGACIRGAIRAVTELAEVALVDDAGWLQLLPLHSRLIAVVECVAQRAEGRLWLLSLRLLNDDLSSLLPMSFL